MKIARSLLILSLLLFRPCLAKRIKALVRVPVADASAMQIGDCTKQVVSYYKNLAYAPDEGAYACTRIHQLLFNEVVTILQELPHGEVLVKTTGSFYMGRFSKKKRSTFWMLKKDLISLSQLPQKFHTHIPLSVDYTKKVKNYSQDVLTLTAPWYDKRTKTTYSVGTRFCRVPENDTDSIYGISLIDVKTKRVRYSSIAKRKALVTYYRTFIRARRVFMSLLRRWAHPPTGVIPYVYGGCSYTVPCPSKKYTRIYGKKCGKQASYWERPDCQGAPRSGFDCSNMILRAAQMAGMPYYYKNTLALINSLRPLKRGEALEEGDLIWYSGHVLIVSDIKKNLIIEAIGYDSGYGRVHEAPIHRIFRGIKNFEQLKRAHHARNFTRRLYNTGKPWRSVHQLRIFKLSSLRY